MSTPDGLPTRERYWAITALWLALTMAVLDASIANVALPTIARDLHAAPSASVWVINAYQLAILVTLLPLAALGEIIEYRRVFVGGMAVFAFASLGCALASNLPELTAARCLQGFGAAGIMSVNGALVRHIFPSRLLGQGVGLDAMVVSVVSVIAPTVASMILAVATWPWLFAVNIPIGLAAVLLGRVTLPESLRSERPLDWIAAGLNVIAFGGVIVGVDLLTRGRGFAAPGAAILAVGALAWVLLIRRSLAQPRPLAPVDLLKDRLFSLSVVTSVSSFAAQMSAFVALPFFLQASLHRSQVQTGLLITPWPVAVAIAAPVAGRLADRYPAAILGGFGLSTMAAGLALLAFLPTTAGPLDIGWRMALCGLGFGFFQAPNNRILLSSAPKARSGAAGGMLATSRLTGQTIGATLVGILLHASSQGATLALLTAAAFAAGGAAISLTRLEKRPAQLPKTAL